jgi:CTP synthase (UTP-ammonia lyase)
VEEAVMERYVGRYELAPGVVLDVTREGTRMFAQLTGQPRFEVFAKSERRFFWKVVPAEVEFRGEGKAGELTLYQNGREIPAKRVE